jgi:hypothetical protein
MNVLKPHLQATVKTLLVRGISQQEIHRKTGVARKTIRTYGQLDGLATEQGDLPPKYPTGQEVATGAGVRSGQNTPPRPPASASKLPKHARSACEPHREWIEEPVRLGHNLMAIYQDLVEQFGSTHKYNSVKRLVRGLKNKDPRQNDRLEFLGGEEAQVSFGSCGPRTSEQARDIPKQTDYARKGTKICSICSYRHAPPFMKSLSPGATPEIFT